MDATTSAFMKKEYFWHQNVINGIIDGINCNFSFNLRSDAEKDILYKVFHDTTELSSSCDNIKQKTYQEADKLVYNEGI